MIARILKDKVVRTVGGQKPVDGNINMSGYATWDKVVDTSSEQTISGIKKFTSVPQVVGDILKITSDPTKLVLSSGAYYVNANTPNMPTTNSGVLFVGLAVIADGDARDMMIFAPDDAAAGFYQAVYNGSAWSGWHRALMDSDLATLNNRISALESKISGGVTS
jgi:hypothetical protein